MEKFLRGPTAVLVVSNEPSVREAIALAIDDAELGPTATKDEVLDAESADTDVDVTAIDCGSLDTAIEALESTPAIGTVVIDDSFSTDALVSFLRAVDDRWPTVPAVITPTDGSEALASDVTRVGSTMYLPYVPGDDDELLDAVAQRLREHDRQYRQALESEMFDYLLDHLDKSIYVKDSKARHLKKASTEGGPAPETAIGKTDQELYYSSLEDTEQTVSDDRRVIDGGETIRDRLETWDDPINDRSLFIRTTKVPWRRDGSVEGLIGISIYVTEVQTRLKQLEATVDRLEQFTSYVSHDLRNPLQVAAGNLELARQTGEAAHLERVAESLERLESMLDEFDTLRDSVDAIDFDDVVDFVPLLQSIWRALDTDEATLHLDVPDGTTIDANGLQVRPLFENLFRNAIKHGGPDVTVRLGTTDDGFFVADDGPGIPAADRNAVFESGYTTAPNGHGTGLQIVADLATTHGWDYRVEESEMGGARFEFSNCLLAEPVETEPDADEELSLTDIAAVGTDERPRQQTFDTSTSPVSITSVGADVGRQLGEFTFAFREIDGPVRIQTRLDGFDTDGSGGKAGVAIRDGTGRDAPFGYVGGLNGTQPEVFWRAERGGEVQAQAVIGRGEIEWYRIDRTADTVSLSISPDGDDWVTVDRREIAVTDPVYAGLVVASPMYEEDLTATFSETTLARLQPTDE